MTLAKYIKVCLLLCLLPLVAASAQAEADHAFKVTQFRAAPGNLPKLLDLLTATDWSRIAGGRPIIMRHSQGNHWDLMLLASNEPCADGCTAEAALEKSINALVDFELSFLATSTTSWQEVQTLNADTGLYHIEMFQAGAGKHEALLRQRIIENDYIERIGGRANSIFSVTLGSDFDYFTIGFYPSLQAYAEPDPATDAEKEAAAVAAGFKNRADVSFLLRELIVGHQDTLAVQVK